MITKNFWSTCSAIFLLAMSSTCFAQYEVSFSDDGRYMAFASRGDNTSAGDNNGYDDVYLLDLISGNTTLVSTDEWGNAGNENSNGAFISGNGRYVVYISSASNIVPRDDKETSSVLVYDQQTKKTSRVSVSSSGVPGNWSSQWGARISPDGRFVTFGSWADNLVPNVTNADTNTFMHDRETGETIILSIDNSGYSGERERSGGRSSMSADGRYVVFTSSAKLVPNDTNEVYEVFLRDTLTMTTSRIAVDNNGNEGNHWSSRATISRDGRVVVFTSLATNLVDNDDAQTLHIFVRDLQQGNTKRISVDSSGRVWDEIAQFPVMSPDGRFIAYHSVTSDFRYDYYYLYDRDNDNIRKYLAGVVLGLSESGFIHYKNHGWVPLGFDPVCPDHDGDGQGMSGNDPCVPFSTDGSEYNEIAYEGVECVDEDGDGWGWQTPYKTPGRSCSTSGAIVNSPIVTSNIVADEEAQAITNTSPDFTQTVAYCIDTDGDGWGWDGAKSCRIGHTIAGTCVDADGDYWGWDGSRSCEIPKR